MFTIENFIKGIQTAFPNVIIESQNDKLTLARTYRNYESSEESMQAIGELSLSELQSIATELLNIVSFNELILWETTSFEIAVQPQNRTRFPPFRAENGMYAISEHNYEIVVSKASNKYMFALLCYFAEHLDATFDFGPLSMRMHRQESITIAEELFELFRIFTVKIIAPKRHSISEFKRMLHSYLFNISYNHNITLSVADFSKDRHPFRRGTRQGGQLFPYKHYNNELTKYYHQAVFTDIPFTQYLAFYHVAEFFFQAISEQDAFYEIENFITRPSFSPYKKEDIRRFYTMIKKKMKEQREDGVWNEKTGFLLCLKKYVPDLEALKNSIDTIDSSALEHYKNIFVEFADDSKIINFEDVPDKIYAAIRDRAYSVRNAIVHSKEGDRLRYEPFKHDKQLAKEIPLIRAIAEEIIINSAKAIDYSFDV